MIPIIDAGLKILDKVIPDAQAREKAKLELMQAQSRGELDLINAQLSAIIAEAKSEDPWTSRARPTFLYVVYFFIVMAFPMGIVFAFHPDAAANVTEGVKLWLEALPDEVYYLFGVGYLGYTGARSLDKRAKMQSSDSSLKKMLGL